ncbi:MAG: hypothetical protein HY073_04480, partial [Deltaproteobacteria bacterium]|nr:hypothetical protein [Deltaproteobacteria bacterium]
NLTKVLILNPASPQAIHGVGHLMVILEGQGLADRDVYQHAKRTIHACEGGKYQAVRRLGRELAVMIQAEVGKIGPTIFETHLTGGLAIRRRALVQQWVMMDEIVSEVEGGTLQNNLQGLVDSFDVLKAIAEHLEPHELDQRLAFKYFMLLSPYVNIHDETSVRRSALRACLSFIKFLQSPYWEQSMREIVKDMGSEDRVVRATTTLYFINVVTRRTNRDRLQKLLDSLIEWKKEAPEWKREIDRALEILAGQ